MRTIRTSNYVKYAHDDERDNGENKTPITPGILGTQTLDKGRAVFLWLDRRGKYPA